jgi:ataxia telangiectasia mutated family protein
VHIDLGVAFDQGKLLNTPETVPFRLTRDIVDGCGAAGVEGVMRRCCEETLTVLRANKESLQTLVEVLIHDPILKWAMTPEQARKRQQEPAEERDVFALEEPGESRMRATATAAADTFAPGAAGVQNADAERALLRVRQKLDGIEEGEPRSVEGQVQQLIQDARDPDKLCRLFPGWAPWV